MTGLKILVTAAVMTAQATTALPTLASVNLGCGDFKQNSDGSWTPNHAFTIGALTVNAISSFHAGEIVGGQNGVDLGAMLDKECKLKS